MKWFNAGHAFVRAYYYSTGVTVGYCCTNHYSLDLHWLLAVLLLIGVFAAMFIASAIIDLCVYLSVMKLIRELIATLFDTLKTGDLIGHLRAWWQVATSRTFLTSALFLLLAAFTLSFDASAGAGDYVAFLPLVMGGNAINAAPELPSSPLPPPPANLLPDPSFRSASGWCFDVVQATTAGRAERSWGHDDTRSVAIFTANEGAAGRWHTCALLSVETGTHYRFGGWIYADFYDNGGARFALSFLDASGDVVGSYMTDWTHDAGTFNPWIELMAEAVAPEEATHAVFAFESQGIGGAWADEVWMVNSVD